jgi:hypothetical protein
MKFPNPFIHGHRYRVRRDFKSWFGVFEIDQQLVFTGSARNHYDGGVAYCFWNIVSGRRQSLDLSDDEEQSYPFDRDFEHLGQELEIVSVPMDDLEFPSRSDVEALRAHVWFLLRFVEGDENLGSYHRFVAENRKAFAASLSRFEFLGLVHHGFRSAQLILDALGVPYTASPRYAWLGNFKPQPPLPLP